ncbi:class I SAM-dependent methyltransferase [Thermodesulfovibrionales bacterium]|nr:class I SAM-dependent methyltransferase [Thermodesulfovibrionales bacterium]MCL0061625.1 class I SAM-dependent methyltransferase [Thermodesulfovibrionales bacterium]MCL0086098.1 class I SAM-dependent methyltransferase [Thermodesulfovibrionales bacterium]
MTLFICLVVIILCLFCANFLSYRILKGRTLKGRKWDLNICCGKTDGGGVNADIKRYKDIPNFVLLSSIYNLPFKDGEFRYVLCSHTMEHVDDPEKFYKELKRVGEHIVIVLPPMWDIAGAFLAVLEHKWVFLTLKKNHTELPKFVSLSFARRLQGLFGQQKRA